MKPHDAFIVVGPESTGTRLVTRLLISAGCAGTGEHVQVWDSSLPSPDRNGAAVWRRSIPHNRKWPSLVDMQRTLLAQGYRTIRVVVTCRDWHATQESQVKARHVPHQHAARKNIQRAYLHIFTQIAAGSMSFVVVPLEALALGGPSAVRAMLALLGLPPKGGESVRNPNQKHYEVRP